VRDFPKIFPGGAKSGEILFLPLEIEKTTFFANNFKIQGGLDPLSPLPTPMFAVNEHTTAVLIETSSLQVGN